MKTLVSLKNILNSQILSKPKEIIGSCSERWSKIFPQRKDDAPIAAVEIVDFSDDGEMEELSEQTVHNLHNVTPKVEVKPRPEVFMLSSAEEVLQTPSSNLNETILEIQKNLEKLSLEQERLTSLLEKAHKRQEIIDSSKKIISKIISGEDVSSNLNRFDDKLRNAENIHASIKDFLLESQKQIENAPPDKRREVVLEFTKNERLLKYIKALYGFKCQICGFTFETKNGGFYSETHYLEFPWDDGKDSLDNLIILCPNHKKMFEYANISIINPKKEEISISINGRRHIIKRIPLR
jgi:hypothetical protein